MHRELVLPQGTQHGDTAKFLEASPRRLQEHEENWATKKQYQRQFEREGDAWILEIEYPESASRYLIEKGSVAVDGISLTVASLKPSNVFSVAIIPHTFENTNLRTARPNDPVNLEFDVLAKYIESLLKRYAVRND